MATSARALTVLYTLQHGRLLGDELSVGATVMVCTLLLGEFSSSGLSRICFWETILYISVKDNILKVNVILLFLIYAIFLYLSTIASFVSNETFDIVGPALKTCFPEPYSGFYSN